MENLSVLTAGQLTSDPPTIGLPKLIVELIRLYHIIIDNTTHFLDNSDVKLMAAKADGIVMVV